MLRRLAEPLSILSDKRQRYDIGCCYIVLLYGTSCLWSKENNTQQRRQILNTMHGALPDVIGGPYRNVDKNHDDPYGGNNDGDISDGT